MKHRFAFLLAEFSYLRIETLATSLEEELNRLDEEAFLFFGKPVNSPLTSQRNENIILNLAKATTFDGIVAFNNTLTPYDGQDMVNRFLKTFDTAKVVTIGETSEGCSSVQLDNYRSIQLTVNHLYDHGVRRFSYVGGPMTNMDALDRSRGVMDFLASKGLTCETFHEGNFAYESGANVIHELLDKGLPLPEAFIFANDEMAIGAHATLLSMGYRVPQDVKLVGFDDNDQERHIIAQLTTVNQGFSNIVFKGLDLLRSKTIENIVVPGELIVRESCGCESQIKKAQEEYFEKKQYMEKVRLLHLSFMDNLSLQALLSVVNTYDQLKQQLKEITIHYPNFEFHLCLFKENALPIDTPLAFEFPESMNCFLSLVHGQFQEAIEYKTENILPESIREKTDTRVFFVYPLRMNHMSYGYIACNSATAQDRRFVSLKDLLNISLSRIEMQRELDNYRSELENLSFKDALTLSYNHRGFHRFSQPRFLESLSKGWVPAVIYGDVDYLKLINDTFGHDYGDAAIIAASDFLNQAFPNEIVARIGGDEYIVFIRNVLGQDLELLQKELQVLMNKKSDELNKSFVFRMSFGFCVYDVSRHHSLEDMIKEADKSLYEARRASSHYYSKPDIYK
jgi:diguanylate cyclase (GGDEF)-like protein